MKESTAQELLEHSRPCGNKEFYYSSSFDNETGDRTKVYSCRKCGHVVYEIVNRKAEALGKEAA